MFEALLADDSSRLLMRKLLAGAGMQFNEEAFEEQVMLSMGSTKPCHHMMSWDDAPHALHTCAPNSILHCTKQPFKQPFSSIVLFLVQFEC